MLSPEISYPDFAKCDIRIGQITKCEEVPKSKKLVKLEVNFGPEVGVRTILAGIKELVGADVGSFVGHNIVAVVNIAPREMMGMTSHGMLLAAKSSAGVLSLAHCGGDPGDMLG